MGKERDGRSRPTLMAVRRTLLEAGLTPQQLVAVFVSACGLRPRAAYRHAHGWTQEQAAEQINLLPVDQHGEQPPAVWAAQISAYESWPHSGRQPPVRHLRLMARAYRTEVRQLLDDADRQALSEHAWSRILSDSFPHTRTFSPRHAAEHHRKPASSPVVPLAEQVRVQRTLEELGDWDELMKRRTLVGTSAMGLLAPQLLTPSTVKEGTTADFLAAQAQLIDSYRRLDSLAGAAAVYQQASEHHRRLLGWHGGLPSTERARAAAVIADSGSLLGWLNSDLDQHPEAGACYRTAAEAAAEANDISRYAYLISRMGLALGECGRHTDALRFADAAVRRSRTAHPVVRSWVTVTRAHAHASLQDERACRSDLDDAADLLGTAAAEGAPPACVAFFDEVHLRKWTGHALVLLGGSRGAEARGILDQTATRWPRTFLRGSAEVSAACAMARIHQGEIEEATRWARRAYDVALRTGSSRNLRRVQHIRARFRPFSDTRAVRDFHEYLLTTPGTVPG